MLVYAPDRGARVLELGCGTGNLTELVAQRYPAAELTLVDGMEEMLACRASRLGGPPGRRVGALLQELELAAAALREMADSHIDFAALARADHGVTAALFALPLGVEIELPQDTITRFAALASEHSTCPSAPGGGDLGYFPREGPMVEAFAAAAFELEVDGTSGVVETQFGYHVIHCTDRQEARVISLEEASAGIRTRLEREKLNELRARHVEKLRAGAEIEQPGT